MTVAHLKHSFVVSASLAALAAASLALPAAAHAQAAPAPAADDGAQTIVVTGFSRSVTNALRIKRDAIGIVDSVTAEDVGKLPDTSIIDSIGRLPGVAVQTGPGGRGEFISIRGFSGDYTGALLNHREIATIDDNRRFDYSQLPSDMFNRVDVIKTSNGSLVASGLAGTVDLQSIDPLKNKRILSLNAQGELNGFHSLNSDQTNKGYKFTGIFSNKFANDTIGLSLGFTAAESPAQSKEFDAWGYANNVNNACPSTNVCQLGGAKWFADTNVVYRQTGFGHIVYKPDNRFEVSFDALYSNYKYRENQRGLEVPLSWSGASETAFTAANGFAQTATYTGVYAVQRNNYNTRDAHTLALGGNLKYALTDKLKLVIDGNYSQAKRHDNAYETYSGTGYNHSGAADTVSITRLASGVYTLTPTLNYTNTSLFKLTDPNGWGYYPPVGSVVQAGYVNEPDFKDTIKGLRAMLQGDLDHGLLKSWELGANYQDRTKDNAFVGYYLVPPAGTTSVAVPSSALVGSVTPAYVNGNTLAYNVPAVLGVLTGAFRNQTQSELTKQWSVREKVLTGYGQLNLDGDLGGKHLSGNIGVQYIHTQQSSTGYDSNAVGTYVLSTAGTKYNFVLPSFNLKVELVEDGFLHLAASRTAARSQFYYENNSQTPGFLDPTQPGTPIYINNGQVSSTPGGSRVVLVASGGNPNLRPYMSTNVDIGFDKYFANGQGVIGVNLYYKDISNFVEPNKISIIDTSGAAFQAQVNASKLTTGGPYTLTRGLLTGPVNSGKGTVQGIELQTTVPFKVLSPALDGFGVRGSASYTDSAIKYSNNTPVTLPGLSAWVVNAQVYFEKYGFNARASYQYRSDFLGEYLAFGAQLQLTSTKARSTLDAQLGYDFKTGRLAGLSLYVQGANLTNSPFVTYSNGDKNQVLNYETYGPTYRVGATMKF